LTLTFILFNDDEWQAGTWIYSSSRHVERPIHDES